jgi:L-asparaginase
MRDIHVFITGGTIDKQYDVKYGVMGFERTSIGNILERGNIDIDYVTDYLMLADSRYFGQYERDVIKKFCYETERESVIITHGTDTMVQTADYLSSIENKTIIMVGAFIPYSVKESDAEFNLGAAVAYSQCLPHGVYICMHGVAYPYDSVMKDYEQHKFIRC